MDAFDLGLYKIFVEKHGLNQILNAFCGILVAIPFLKYSFYPNLQKNRTILWVELLDDQEILREGMNISNTLSIYHNS